jgi:hypothetical protein
MKKFFLTALTAQMAQNCKYILRIRKKSISVLFISGCKLAREEKRATTKKEADHTKDPADDKLCT